MQPLRLDYTNTRRRAGRVDMVVLVIGLVCVIASGIVALSLLPRLSTQEAQLALKEKSDLAAADSRRSGENSHQLRAELKQANSVVELLSLPWDALFADIETSQEAQIALLAVDPDPDKRVLTITAEAKDFNAMLAYMRLLQKRASLRDVYLKSHHIDLNSSERPIRFVLVASWVIPS